MFSVGLLLLWFEITEALPYVASLTKSHLKTMMSMQYTDNDTAVDSDDDNKDDDDDNDDNDDDDDC